MPIAIIELVDTASIDNGKNTAANTRIASFRALDYVGTTPADKR
jgi:hypothetical protein